jgi:hypothetical protein
LTVSLHAGRRSISRSGLNSFGGFTRAAVEHTSSFQLRF